MTQKLKNNANKSVAKATTPKENPMTLQQTTALLYAIQTSHIEQSDTALQAFSARLKLTPWADLLKDLFAQHLGMELHYQRYYQHLSQWDEAQIAHLWQSYTATETEALSKIDPPSFCKDDKPSAAPHFNNVLVAVCNEQNPAAASKKALPQPPKPEKADV